MTKLGEAIEECIGCAEGDLHPDDIDARKRGELLHTDRARAELRALKDCALILRALARGDVYSPEPHITAILEADGSCSVIVYGHGGIAAKALTGSVVDGLPVLSDEARRVLESNE